MSGDCVTLVEQVEDHEERLDRVEDWRLDMVGTSGNNGRVGVIRKDVDGLKADRSKFIAGILGSIVVAGLAIYTAGVRKGTEEAEVRALKATVADQQVEIQQLRAFVLRLSIPTIQPLVTP